MPNKVDYQGLRNASSKISTSANNVDRILKEALQEMQTITNSWESDASAQTLAKFQNLSKNFENFYQLLQDYSRFLEQTAQTYEAADRAIKAKADELLN